MVKKQNKKVKQQASLFTFFGKNKKKRSSDSDNCNDETVHDKPARKHIKLSSADNNNNVDTVVNNNKSCNAAEVLKVSSHDVADEKVDKKEGAPSQLPERNNTPQKVDELVEKPKSNNPAIESSSDTSDTDTDSSGGDDSEEEEESNKNQQGAPPDEEDNNKYKGKSPYEILREKNIERNNARLAALGLLVGVQQQSNDNDSKKKKRKKTGTKKATIASVPTRRSGRLKKPVVTNSGTVLEAHNDLVSSSSSNEKTSMEFEEEEELFTVSPLIEYQMTSSSTTNESTSSDSIETKDSTIDISSISTLTPSGPRLNPPSGLNAIYSLQFHPQSWESNVNNQNGSSSSSSWLVGAGKSGLIALWDCSKHNNKNLVQDSDEEGGSYINPVISWKGHSGRWIADARFVPPSTSSISSNSTSSSSTVPSRLLTAGNDGSVCYWDLTLTSSQGVPKLLEQSTKLLHGSGIFSMDVSIPSSSSSTTSCSPYFVTGSKDKSIAVTTLDQLSNEPIWRSDYHTAKVGSVSFSSSNNNNPLIASASDDGCVAIHDARLNGMKGSTVAVLEDAHVKPHSAVWQPGSETIFMTGEYILYVYKSVPLDIHTLHISYATIFNI